MNKKLSVAVLLIAVLGGGYYFWANPKTEFDSSYAPVIDPAEFSTNITNPYFSLPIGKKMVFEAETKAGKERIEISITGETKEVVGVTTLIYHDREFLNGELEEETRDYLAQDTEGNVWYFGEDVDNYKNGVVADHDGAWLSGVDGAKAGIWFPGDPTVGKSYRQEYYFGQAEDIAEVVETGVTVTTGLGTFNDCVKTYDWTPLEKKSQENKYYCSEIGGLVLVEDLITGDRVELVESISVSVE